MDKASFLIYLDYQQQFELLTDEQAGKLIKAIIKYEKTGETLELDGMTKMAFSFIKTQLDRDREKYQARCEKNRENAKKGGRPKKQKVNEKLNGFKENQMEAKKPDNDNEEDKEDENDNEEDVKKKKTKKKFQKPTVEEIQKYCLEKNYKIDAQYFYDYYESNGWKVGKNAMKDWQATIRTWQKRNKSEQSVAEEWLNE